MTGALVVGGDFETHRVRVEVFSKIRAMFLPLRLSRWPPEYGALEIPRQVEQIDQIPLAVVNQAQQVAVLKIERHVVVSSGLVGISKRGRAGSGRSCNGRHRGRGPVRSRRW